MRYWGTLLLLLLIVGCTDTPTSEFGTFEQASVDINSDVVEKSIFNKVNQIRAENKLIDLKWNEEIADVARASIIKQAKGGYFAHTSPTGEDIYNGLDNAKIFYITAGENLYYMGGDDMSELGDFAVDDWMKSPGHKSLIVDYDELYNEGGVGVYCDENICYVSMIFVSRWQKDEVEISPQYTTFLSLYDQTYPFEFDMKVRIKIKSNEPINAYFVPDKNEWKAYLGTGDVNYYEIWKSKLEIDEYLDVKKGEVIIIENVNDVSAVVSIEMIYLEELSESVDKSIYKEEGINLSPILVDDAGTLGARIPISFGPFEFNEPTNLNIEVTTDGTLSFYIFPSEQDYLDWFVYEPFELYKDCWIKWIDKSASKSCGMDGTAYITLYNRMEGEVQYTLKITKDDTEDVEVSPLQLM